MADSSEHGKRLNSGGSARRSRRPPTGHGWGLISKERWPKHRRASRCTLEDRRHPRLTPRASHRRRSTAHSLPFVFFPGLTKRSLDLRTESVAANGPVTSRTAPRGADIRSSWGVLSLSTGDAFLFSVSFYFYFFLSYGSDIKGDVIYCAITKTPRRALRCRLKLPVHCGLNRTRSARSRPLCRAVNARWSVVLACSMLQRFTMPHSTPLGE